MKTISEIKDEVAKDRGFKNWEAIYTAGGYEYNQKRINEVAKRYAEEALKEAAERADIEEYYSGNNKKVHMSFVKHLYTGGRHICIDKSSILNIINELK